MPHIYANATQVLIYLGPDTDYAGKIFVDAKGFAADSSNGPPVSNAMLHVLRIPWFTRIWVLQEVATARKALVLSSNSCIE